MKDGSSSRRSRDDRASKAFSAQRVDPAGQDVDERHVVTHLDEATAGGRTDYSRTHNKIAIANLSMRDRVC